MGRSKVRRLCERGKVEEAVEAVEEMGEGRVSREVLCWLLKGCIARKDVVVGRKVHGMAVRAGYGGDMILAKHVIRMYACGGKLEEARQVFWSLPAANTFVWASIIAAHGDNGRGEEAVELYGQMRGASVQGNEHLFVCVLKACGSMSDLSSGKLVHRDVVEGGFESSLFVGSALVDMYAKCNSLEDARMLFDRLPEKDVVTWNAMMSGYVGHGLGREALDVYADMGRRGVVQSRSTFMNVLKACGSIGDLERGRNIHAQIVDMGLEGDELVGSTLVDMYSKCGSLEDARQVFDGLSAKDVVTWTAMISGYAKHGLHRDALHLFVCMQQQGMEADPTTFLTMCKVCGTLKAVQAGKHIHARLAQMGLQDDIFLGSALVDMYAKCGSLVDARTVFDGLPVRDRATWTAMVAGYAHNGLGQEALALFARMEEEDGMAPDAVTFACILKACASIGALQHGRRIHAQILQRGLESDAFVGSSLVDMYVKCGSLDKARIVFDRLPTRDLVTWNVMIAGCAEHGLAHEALGLYTRMQQDGISASKATFMSVLHACGSIGAIHVARQVHARILEQGLEADVFVGSSLVDMYTKVGSLREAQQVFDRLPTKDAVTWTALINGYGQHNQGAKAIQFFQAMQQDGCKPDATTFTCLLVACSHMGLVDAGKTYFKDMVEQHGVKPGIEHYTCMVDLLGRSGCLDEAETMLQSMPYEAHTVGCLSLLSACKHHGDMDRARRCFSRLVQLEPHEAAGYVLMSNMYSDAGEWEQANTIERLRKCAGAEKKLAMASIQVNKHMYDFVVGERHDDTSLKLKNLNLHMEEKTHPAFGGPVHDKKEDALCGHAEKLALAFGLLNTPQGSTLFVRKNLRMCNHCHTGTKILSRIEKREIVVRDAHRVHYFKDGLCSCGDHH